ncbi:myosin light chain kinase family member 4 isoform X2 [Moschus berezovskii]|nr:myosin light chain kinase family member 4 isoform X2 [Moschus berezovskii]
MLTVKRLEGINTCCRSDQLEKMDFFQCVEEVEKCFLEESAGEQDLRSGKNQAKEQVWSLPGLKDTAPATEERTAAPTERSSQKNLPSSEEETFNKLDEKQAENAPASLVQRSSAAFQTERPHDEPGDPALRNSTEPRESEDRRDTSCPGRLSRQEAHSSGAEQGSADESERLVFKGEEKGLRSKGEPGDGGAKEDGGSEMPHRTGPPRSSNKEQCVDRANGGQPHERRVSSVKATPPSRAMGKAATSPVLQKADPTEALGGGKRRGGEESLVQEENKKSRTDVAADAPAPPAPFDHRIVTARQAAVNSFYTVSRTEILGGGRFGQVHKCEEKATGLKLAAKIIKTRGMKDKDDVKNEISVMNQLDHVNLIQLYDAFESKNDIVLVMEYVDGGELFDRIIDDNCTLTELDAILFIRQICEGIRHMHQMYILHLDLKPENILCVNRDTKQIKIIDFGLARRYKPREKLKVNFGTPEFLAPEVVNYDFVSFPTDMWSVGVITYMLLSGLSPFLGDDDAETLNNILACRWDLEDQEFQDVSEEAREFISKLLIKEKSWRISASEALKHPWLSDHKLHSRLSTQKRKSCCSDAQDLVTK